VVFGKNIFLFKNSSLNREFRLSEIKYFYVKNRTDQNIQYTKLSEIMFNYEHYISKAKEFAILCALKVLQGFIFHSRVMYIKP